MEISDFDISKHGLDSKRHISESKGCKKIGKSGIFEFNMKD